tara:strand:+ start:198 stop:476 length:279 start_codon:yes stop_codon:yes gene_type:complete
MPFETTRKGNRGTIFGFILSVAYMTIFWVYIGSQFALFFNFEADTHEESLILVNFEDEGDKHFDDFKMGIGLMLSSAGGKYNQDILDEELLS